MPSSDGLTRSWGRKSHFLYTSISYKTLLDVFSMGISES